MRAVRFALDGDASLRARRVVVQGSGHVGSHLARLLVAEGAEVVVSDLLEWRAEALASELGVVRVGIDDALVMPCDILAPCGLGNVFDDESVPRLQCRAIVGAANNQLGVVGADRMLAARGILYAPDFVVNAGGIINIAEEFVGYNRERALAHAAEIEATTARVISVAAGARYHAVARRRAAGTSSARGGRRATAMGTRRSRRVDERRTPPQTPPLTTHQRTGVSKPAHSWFGDASCVPG